MGYKRNGQFLLPFFEQQINEFRGSTVIESPFIKWDTEERERPFVAIQQYACPAIRGGFLKPFSLDHMFQQPITSLHELFRIWLQSITLYETRCP